MNNNIMDFWLNHLQQERRVDLQRTINEMARVSAIIYSIPALTLFIILLFPTWEGLDKPLLYAVIFFALLIAVTFYFLRSHVPLWMALGHVPVGIVLVGVGMYATGSEVGVIVAALYVMSATYSYHFFTPLTAAVLILFSAFVFGFVARHLGIEGWLALSVASFGFSYTAGMIVHMLVKRIHRLATIDPLTGLFNRQTWDMFLAQQIAVAERYGKSFKIMMIDLNKFKKVNDRQGHLAGDKILHKVGVALQNSVRAVDHVARWGGDEFIILFPDAGDEVLSLVKNRLEKELADVILFSVGETSWQEGDDGDSLLSRADTALYADKQSKKKPEESSFSVAPDEQPA
jgi:diguanylate cyclase (GGDEF)-like protein